jgi:hypothetical protein
MAHRAQINRVDMTLADLQRCAGVTDKATRIDDRTQILTCNVNNDSAGGVEVTLPVVGGGYTVGGSGSHCRATFRVEENRVASLFCSGNNDRPIGEDGVRRCPPLIHSRPPRFRRRSRSRTTPQAWPLPAAERDANWSGCAASPMTPARTAAEGCQP